jgi:hypothetical protein
LCTRNIIKNTKCNPSIQEVYKRNAYLNGANKEAHATV